ncbi:MAG: M48 family metallopeptidase [Candidatus Hydrothermarchaeota archaeon]
MFAEFTCCLTSCLYDPKFLKASLLLMGALGLFFATDRREGSYIRIFSLIGISVILLFDVFFFLWFICNLCNISNYLSMIFKFLLILGLLTPLLSLVLLRKDESKFIHHEEIQRMVDTVSRKLGIKSPTAKVIDSGKKNAFVFGIRKPKIAISLGLLESLERNEINAVIAHELAHIKSWGGIFHLILSVIGRFSPMIPLLHFLKKKCLNEIEILADSIARKNGYGEDLKNALFKIHSDFSEEGLCLMDRDISKRIKLLKV